MFVHGKALELLQAREATGHIAFLPTFMMELDIVLRGGLLAGSITEVSCFLCGILEMLYYVYCEMLNGVCFHVSSCTCS